VVQATNVHPLVEAADVALPGLTFAEKEGTFTNWAGRVQRVRRAIDPEGQPTDGEIFLRMGRRLGMEIPPGPFDATAIWAEIAGSVPRYRGLAWETLGSLGLPAAEG
jgi:predicted molibdopterin-dependent oxidoreductase YjgC